MNITEEQIEDFINIFKTFEEVNPGFASCYTALLVHYLKCDKDVEDIARTLAEDPKYFNDTLKYLEELIYKGIGSHVIKRIYPVPSIIVPIGPLKKAGYFEELEKKSRRDQL